MKKSIKTWTIISGILLAICFRSTGALAASITATLVSPPDNSTSVPLNTTIQVAFSDNINQNTITPATFKLHKQGESTPVSGTFSFSANQDTVFFTPASALSQGQLYVVELVANTIKSSHGNNYVESAYSWKFLTWSKIIAETFSVTNVQDDQEGCTATVKHDLNAYLATVRKYPNVDFSSAVPTCQSLSTAVNSVLKAVIRIDNIDDNKSPPEGQVNWASFYNPNAPRASDWNTLPGAWQGQNLTTIDNQPSYVVWIRPELFTGGCTAIMLTSDKSAAFTAEIKRTPTLDASTASSWCQMLTTAMLNISMVDISLNNIDYNYNPARPRGEVDAVKTHMFLIKPRLERFPRFLK